MSAHKIRHGIAVGPIAIAKVSAIQISSDENRIEIVLFLFSYEKISAGICTICRWHGHCDSRSQSNESIDTAIELCNCQVRILIEQWAIVKRLQFLEKQNLIFFLVSRLCSTMGIEMADFASRELVFGLTTYESYLDLSAQDLEFGFNETRRDRILRTYVRNVYFYHLNEIYSALKVSKCNITS